ncbi:uncharacterized protein BJ212DRAFT_1479593 [Suillus subaureus]|uniref:Uncharacterized protein n=1 Tax=Suillus subaureus TaxID=48587 RepID=A0A9P7EDB8_9AGAM|nr:uncharacterized protein BJ212DRAFT_1479593 [Suillus subaureus]KAG1818592.1 hypothetical protein BJ212DRAFT_1479593 [Suillus subaureus]
MAKAHGKDWNPGSASAEMIWAVMTHSDYDPEQCGGTVAEIVSSIFEMFPDKGQEKGKKGKKGSDEDGDKDDSSPSSSDKETDSNQEHDNNEDGEEAEEGTNLCTLWLLWKEHLQKDAAHIDSLHVEVLNAQKLFNGAMKLTSIKHNTLGQNFVPFYTYEWSAATGGTRACCLHILACIAIMEQTIINTYQIGLLDDSSGGAAAICLTIKDNTKNYRVACPILRKKQKQKGRGLEGIKKVTQLVPEHVNLTWPDQIDIAAISQVDFKLEVKLGSQKHDLLVHSCIAWEDITGVAETHKCPPPPLCPEVQGVLEVLIKELSINTYHQHQPLKDKKISFDDSISPSDHLHVLHRAVENETAISHIMRNKKFLVPSQRDKLMLLEAEARTCQRHWECAREHDKKEELLDANKSPDGNSARSTPVQSDIDNQAGTKTRCLPAPIQCSAAMITTAGCRGYGPHLRHDHLMPPTLDVDLTLDANLTLDADPTLDVNLTVDVAPTLKKHQASHSVSSTDSYGGYITNGKPDRKRRQLSEDNASLPGNTHFQFQEDDESIFSKLVPS